MTLIPAAVIGVLGGAGFLWAAFSSFHDLARMEAEGGSRKMNVFAILLYKIGGKWAVSGFLGLFGAVFLGFGLMAVWELVQTELRKRNE